MKMIEYGEWSLMQSCLERVFYTPGLLKSGIYLVKGVRAGHRIQPVYILNHLVNGICIDQNFYQYYRDRGQAILSIEEVINKPGDEKLNEGS